jgi:DNA-directed RNA polymerase II subunit RPB1
MLSADLQRFPKCKVKGIRFTLLTDEEIAKRSVCQVLHPTITDRMLPKNGGPNDHNMGTVDARMLCGYSQCQHPVATCLGHEGHIVLPWPIILPHYLPILPKLLRRICYWGSHAMLDAKDLEMIQKVRATCKESTGKNLFAEITKDMKKAGHRNCPICNGPQPLWSKQGVTIRREWPTGTKWQSPEERVQGEKTWTPPELQRLLKRIPKKDCELLGWFVGKHHVDVVPSHFEHSAAADAALAGGGLGGAFPVAASSSASAAPVSASSSAAAPTSSTMHDDRPQSMILCNVEDHDDDDDGDLDDLDDCEKDSALDGSEVAMLTLGGASGPQLQGNALDWGSHPGSTMPSNLVIPPPTIRQSVVYAEGGKNRGQSDLTHRIQDITKAKQGFIQEQDDARSKGILDTLGPTKKMMDHWHNMQSWVAIYMYNDSQSMKAVSQHRPLTQKSIRQRIIGKDGRMRGNLMGKRVDFSARSVIVPDPFVDANEVVISRYMAMNLTWTDTVTDCPKQRAALQKAIWNGPNELEGAKSVEYPDGQTVQVLEHNKRLIHIYKGCKVFRHLRTGDMGVLNRNPTLHKKGLMGLWIRVFEDDCSRTLRFNPLLCPPYNADFDGDEMNLHIPQSYQARAECMALLLADHQVMNASNGMPIIYPTQEPALAIYMLTRKDTFVDRSTFMMLLAELRHAVPGTCIKGAQDLTTKIRLPVPAILKGWKEMPMEGMPGRKYLPGGGPLWTGKQVLSMILPTGVYLDKTRKDLVNGTDPLLDHEESRVLVEAGQVLLGAFDKSLLSNMIQFIWRIHGGPFVILWMSDLQRYLDKWFSNRGFSVGEDDSKPSVKVEAEVQRILNGTARILARLQDETQRAGLSLASIEPRLSEEMDSVINKVGHAAMSEMSDKNAYYCQVVAKSKGSVVNISQIMGSFGQQHLSGRRILAPNKHTRVDNHYRVGDENPVANGLVCNSTFRGCTPTEQFTTCIAGREGMTDTTVKTSTTGYIQRRLGKSAEDNTAHHDGSVRSNDDIISFSYGCDGLDGNFMERVTIGIITLSDDDILQRYGYRGCGSSSSGGGGGATGSGTESQCAGGALVSTSRRWKSLILREVDQLCQIRDSLRQSKYSNISMEVKNDVLLPVHIRRYLRSWCDEIRGNVTGEASAAAATSLQHLQRLKSQDITLELATQVVNKVEECCRSIQRLARSQPCAFLCASIKTELTLQTVLVEHAMTLGTLTQVLQRIQREYTRARIDAGEMVGEIGGHCLGEPTMQMTLNSHSISGTGCRTVLSGIPRMQELMDVTSHPRLPSDTIFFDEPFSQQESWVKAFKDTLPMTVLRDVVVPSLSTVHEDPVSAVVCTPTEDEPVVTLAASMRPPWVSTDVASGFVIRMVLHKAIMTTRNLVPSDVARAIERLLEEGGGGASSGDAAGTDVSSSSSSSPICDVVYSQTNHASSSWWIRVRIMFPDAVRSRLGVETQVLSDRLLNQHLLQYLQSNVYLGGVQGVRTCTMRKVTTSMIPLGSTTPHPPHTSSSLESRTEWVVDTVGSNLTMIWTLPHVDWKRTSSNDPREMNQLMGIEAGGLTMFNELRAVLSADGGYVQDRHLLQQTDVIMQKGWLMPISRSGINRVSTSTLMKCSFEQTMDEFSSAALFAGFDKVQGIAESIVLGVAPRVGSNFNLKLLRKAGAPRVPGPGLAGRELQMRIGGAGGAGGATGSLLPIAPVLPSAPPHMRLTGMIAMTTHDTGVFAHEFQELPRLPPPPHPPHRSVASLPLARLPPPPRPLPGPPSSSSRPTPGLVIHVTTGDALPERASESPTYTPTSPGYEAGAGYSSPVYPVTTGNYSPTSPQYAPTSPHGTPTSPPVDKHGPIDSPMYEPLSPAEDGAPATMSWAWPAAAAAAAAAASTASTRPVTSHLFNLGDRGIPLPGQHSSAPFARGQATSFSTNRPSVHVEPLQSDSAWAFQPNNAHWMQQVAWADAGARSIGPSSSSHFSGGGGGGGSGVTLLPPQAHAPLPVQNVHMPLPPQQQAMPVPLPPQQVQQAAKRKFQPSSPTSTPAPSGHTEKRFRSSSP